MEKAHNRNYLKKNLIRGLTTVPSRISLSILIIILLYFFLAGFLGFSFKVFHVRIFEGSMLYLLPFTLFIFPSFLEEAFFRGVLIPNDTVDKGPAKILFYILMSTLIFVAWHPVNALLINKTAIPLFLNPFFLILVALLGATCSLSYIFSRSLWIPILIHWLTVLVWVVFLGGRNKILEL